MNQQRRDIYLAAALQGILASNRSWDCNQTAEAAHAFAEEYMALIEAKEQE
jgi:hypothetical protein